MKGLSVLFLLLIASAFSFGQSMMSTSNSSSGNSTTMMSANPMKADTRVGNQLRYAPSSGTKLIFTTLDAAQALAAKHPTVLFFAADWCPYCQADLRDINANGDRLGEVAIVVADYDKATELKAKYRITAQDTFVQIDANGKQKAIWAGGGVDGILSHLVRS